MKCGDDRIILSGLLVQVEGGMDGAKCSGMIQENLLQSHIQKHSD